MYFNGMGIDKDLSKAFEYTKKSAEQYYPDAEYNLAIFYLKGEGTAINPSKAYRYLMDSKSEVKEAKVFLDKLDSIEKKANLQNYFCSGECILTYEIAGIPINDKSFADWEKKGVTEQTIPIFLKYGIKDPKEMALWIEKTGDAWKAEKYLEDGYLNPDKAIMIERAKIGAYIAVFVLIIIGIVLGIGENRKIVVFRNYDDLGLTFLIPVSFVLIMLVFPVGMSALNIKNENASSISLVIGIVVSAMLFLKVLIITFKENKSAPRAVLAMLVKIPLSILWVFALIGLIQPSGKTQQQRRESRQTSLLIFTLLTPIVAALVVEKSGFFSPKAMLKGKQIGSHNRDLL